MPSRFCPSDYARAHGLIVIERPMTSFMRGWFPDQQTIVVNSDVAPHIRRGNIGHILAHAVLGHPCCTTPTGEVLDAPPEWAADKWAARKMIDRDRLAQSSEQDALQLAADLNVLPAQIAAYHFAYGVPSHALSYTERIFAPPVPAASRDSLPTAVSIS